jgi:hypothetical protein
MDGHLDAGETVKQAAIGCVTAGVSHGAFKAIKRVRGAGPKDGPPTPPESEPPATPKPDSQSGSAAGKSAAEVGAAREYRVAQITGGQRAADLPGGNYKVVEPGVGPAEVDVIGPNGELIYVGGPAKAINPGEMGQKLRVIRYAADQAGVRAQAYFVDGTPDSVLILASKWLGAENVFTFPM